MEAWPAAGGGLLLGMIVPALAGAAPLRHPIKNLFLRIDGRAAIIIPYVRLEPEVAACAAAVVAAELNLPLGDIVMDDRAAAAGAGIIADLCPDCELGLTLIAAAARGLLKAAAAETWHVAPRDCVVADGMVRGPKRRASFTDLTAGAALQRLPAVVILASGRAISLRSTGG